LLGPNNGYFCGNNVNSGLTVNNATVGESTFVFFSALAFGELNAGCAGGRVNGDVSLTNISAVGTELDGYVVNGGLTFANDSLFTLHEVEATTVKGSASCDAVSNVQNDGSSPGGGPNSYTGTNNGCPA
jgi:hypothetical protein